MLLVSKFVEEAIKANKEELGYNKTYDEDPYLPEVVLCSLCTVSIFGCIKPFNPECKLKLIWYQDEFWKSSIQKLGSAHVKKIS